MCSTTQNTSTMCIIFVLVRFSRALPFNSHIYTREARQLNTHSNSLSLAGVADDDGDGGGGGGVVIRNFWKTLHSAFTLNRALHTLCLFKCSCILALFRRACHCHSIINLIKTDLLFKFLLERRTKQRMRISLVCLSAILQF